VSDFLGFEAFFDGILMGAGEGGENKLAGIWMSRVNR
jgi:hypothetical protein